MAGLGAGRALGRLAAECALGRSLPGLLASAGPPRAHPLGRFAALCWAGWSPRRPGRSRLRESARVGPRLPAWAAVAAGPGELGRFGTKSHFSFRYFVNFSNHLNIGKLVINHRKIIKMSN